MKSKRHVAEVLEHMSRHVRKIERDAKQTAESAGDVAAVLEKIVAIHVEQTAGSAG